MPSVDRAAEATGGEVMALSRAGVSVRLVGVAEATDDPSLPFLLQRADGDISPESREADHRVHPTGIVRMKVASPNSNAWAHRLPVGDTELNVAAGAAALLTVDIALADGTLARLTSQTPCGEA